MELLEHFTDLRERVHGAYRRGWSVFPFARQRAYGQHRRDQQTILSRLENRGGPRLSS